MSTTSADPLDVEAFLQDLITDPQLKASLKRLYERLEAHRDQLERQDSGCG